jgi:hypothetical protein
MKRNMSRLRALAVTIKKKHLFVEGPCKVPGNKMNRHMSRVRALAVTMKINMFWFSALGK